MWLLRGEGENRQEGRGVTQRRGGEGSRLSMNGGREGVNRVVRVSLFIVFICPTALPFPSVSLSFPPPLSFRQPLGSVWLIKERRRRRWRQGVDTVLSVWAVCTAGPGDQVKGSPCGAPTAPTAPTRLCLPQPTPSPPLSRKPFCGDETAGLLGWPGLRIRIRLARALSCFGACGACGSREHAED
ncbi:hypothetical protein INR49_025840 [Caranx melampygus]|nr:hypothetical protein INR49_025840 [Caranx melampygus]